MFNLQSAMNGAYMLTKEGYEARFVTVLADERVPARLIVEVAKATDRYGKDFDFEMVNYYLDGSFAGCKNHPMDLMIVIPSEIPDFFVFSPDRSKLPWVNNSHKLKKHNSPYLLEYRNLNIMRMLKKTGWTMDTKSDYYFDESLLNMKGMVNDLLGNNPRKKMTTEEWKQDMRDDLTDMGTWPHISK